MEPGTSHEDSFVLPTRQRNRSGAVVDFNAKQFTKALDAEAKALRSIHTFLWKTLKNLEVERTCLDVMARTASGAGGSEAVLAQAAMQQDPAEAHRVSQPANDACSRFWENLLPAVAADDADGSQGDLSLPAGFAESEHTGAVASGTGKRGRQRGKRGQGQQRGKQKQAKTGVEETGGACRPARAARGATLNRETVSCIDQANESSDLFDNEGASEGLDDVALLSAAIHDAKELLAEEQGEEKHASSDLQELSGSGVEDIVSSLDELIPDQELAAMAEMSAILDAE